MKVLLLEHPRGRSANHFNDIANTPLSSCLMSGYIASLLQANDIETDILDAYLGRYSFQRMVEEVVYEDYDVLGIHLVYSWEHTPTVLHAIDEIGSRMGVPILAYGFYPTFAYDSILTSHPSIHGIITGEPEYAFLEFCLKTQKGEDPRAIDGLAFRHDGDRIACNKGKTIDHLDRLPFPYRTSDHMKHVGGNILGSRGCYGNCTFCYINQFYGKRCNWRGRTPDNIMQEVQHVLSYLSSRYIYFIDANFFGPGDEGQVRAEAIAERLQHENGIVFGLECRVNDIQNRSLGALARAGLRDVFLGVESGSNGSLKRMRKGTTVEQGVNAIRMLRDHGIEPHIGFIMFESDSTLQDIRDNFNFLYSNRLLNRLATTVDLLYHPQIVFMGTDSFKILRREKRMRVSPGPSYQGIFNFKDDRVHVMAEVMASLCHHVLKQMDDVDSPIYWCRNLLSKDHHVNSMDDRMNRWLVGFFEDLLKRLECRETICTEGLKNQSINQFMGMMRDIIPGSTIHEEPLYQQ